MRRKELLLRTEEISTMTNLSGNESQAPVWALPASSKCSASDSGAGAQLCHSQALGSVTSGFGRWAWSCWLPKACGHSLHLGYALSCRFTAHTLQKTVPGLSSWETRPARLCLGSPATLKWGHILAYGFGDGGSTEGEEALNQNSVNAWGDQGQIFSGSHPGTGWGGCEGPSGLQLVVLGKFFGMFYSSSASACLRLLLVHLRQDSRLEMKVFVNPGRGRVEGKPAPGNHEAPLSAWSRVQRELGRCLKPSWKALLLFLLQSISPSGQKLQKHKVQLTKWNVKHVPRISGGLAPAFFQTLLKTDLKGTSVHWPLLGYGSAPALSICAGMSAFLLKSSL